MIDSVRSGKNLVVGVIFLLAVIFYIGGLGPSIAWRDASEFVTVVHSLGISHPAGSPTYSLLAKPLTFIPLGNIALRINLFSALMGAMTVSILFILLYDLLCDTSLPIRLCGALSGSIFLLVSESFWRFSEVAEVYTLQNFLIIVLMTLLIKARHYRLTSPVLSLKLYWIFAFLYGLSAGVHVAMALFAPAFLLTILLAEPRMFQGKAFAFLTFFFLFGFAVYLYLPLRSLSNPVYDWGDPQAFSQFWNHITDRKDAPLQSGVSWAKLPYQIRVYMANLLNEFSTFGVALGIIGCLHLFRRDKPLSLLLGLVFLGNVAFFVRSWTAAFGFIPSFLIFSMWITFGVRTCLACVSRLYQRQQEQIRIPRMAVDICFVSALVVAIGGLGIRHSTIAYKTENYTAEAYGKELLRQLPTDAIIFSSYSWFPLLYLQHVEHRRPDLTTILQGDVIVPQYYGYLSKERFPNIRLSPQDEPFVMATGDYFWLLSQLNHQEHPLFWEPEPVLDSSIQTNLIPQGLLFAFDPMRPLEATPASIQTHLANLTKMTNYILAQGQDKEATDLLASKTYFFGRYYQRRKQPEAAAAMYRIGLKLRPEDEYIRNAYGKYLLSKQQYQLAFEQFEAAHLAKPIYAPASHNLGTLLLSRGRNKEALYHLDRALTFGSASPDLLSLLAETHIRLGQYAEAAQALSSARSLYKDSIEADGKPEPESQLAKKIDWVHNNLQHLQRGTFGSLMPLAEVFETPVAAP